MPPWLNSRLSEARAMLDLLLARRWNFSASRVYQPSILSYGARFADEWRVIVIQERIPIIENDEVL